MERITISVDESLARDFDRLIAERGYGNRSEAIRDILRRELEAQRPASHAGEHCVANLSYVYDHHERELAERLTSIQHAHHDLTVSTMHAHLDHDSCIESVILRGPTEAVRRFADSLCAERGVRHGQLNLVSVEVSGGGAHHPYRPRSALGHVHLKPRS